MRDAYDEGMRAQEWAEPDRVLAAAGAMLGAPMSDLLETLSNTVVGLLPHRAMAMLSGDCARSPVRTHGPAELTSRITSSELARLAAVVDIEIPRVVETMLAGRPHQVLAVAATGDSAPIPSAIEAGDRAATIRATTAGALLAIVLEDDIDTAAPQFTRAMRVMQALWGLITAHLSSFADRAEPVPLALTRATASERARVFGELTDSHSAALTGILGALRSRGLDDAAARRVATGIAVSAIIDLRAAADLDRDLSVETVGEAFARLAERLDPVVRHSALAVEMAGPGHQDLLLPKDIATAARAITRGTVLVMLEQDPITRIRVAWEVGTDELVIRVRDDGPGDLAPDALAVHRLTERAQVLDGALTVEATRGWGTAVTARLPLTPVDQESRPSATLFASLNPREREVLEQLALGVRNRGIAQRLKISESTVKFHVSNILTKLDVTSRGEAAALARRA